jgi:hypothetical protein
MHGGGDAHATRRSRSREAERDVSADQRAPGMHRTHSRGLRGWLGKHWRKHQGPERKFKDRATSISIKLATMRVRVGIMGAYGEKAEQLGLG